MLKQKESFVRRSCIDESQPQSSIVGSACPSWRGGRFFSTRQYGHPRHWHVSQSEPRLGLHEARHLPIHAALIQGSGGATICVSGIGYVVGYVISDSGCADAAKRWGAGGGGGSGRSDGTACPFGLGWASSAAQMRHAAHLHVLQCAGVSHQSSHAYCVSP